MSRGVGGIRGEGHPPCQDPKSKKSVVGGKKYDGCRTNQTTDADSKS